MVSATIKLWVNLIKCGEFRIFGRSSGVEAFSEETADKNKRSKMKAAGQAEEEQSKSSQNKKKVALISLLIRVFISKKFMLAESNAQ